MRCRGLLTGDVTLRNSDLIYGPYRRTCAAIKHKCQSLLGDLRNRGNLSALHRDIEKNGRRRRVVIPDRMMNGLKMPDPLTGRGVEAHQALSVEVVAESVAAVIVAGRRLDRKVNVAERWISAHWCPYTCVSGVLGGVAAPGCKATLLGSGNGIKTPAQLTRINIISSDFPFKRLGRFRRTAEGERSAYDHHIIHNNRRRTGTNRCCDGVQRHAQL